MYNKEITNLIIYYWGKGLTAEETQTVIEEKKGVHLATKTIYRKRHSLTAEQIIDRLFTDQRRDISLADVELRLKHRGELLKILIPQHIITDSTITKKAEVNYNIKVTAAQELLLDALARKYIKSSNTEQSASIH